MSETPKKLSFNDAYERLREITDELNSAKEIAPDQLIALLEEGKGLEKALRTHLEEVAGRVEAIERGEGLVRYEIDSNIPSKNEKQQDKPMAETTSDPASDTKFQSLTDIDIDNQDKSKPSDLSWEF